MSDKSKLGMRLFIAINLPQEIKNKIWKDFAYARDFLEFARFTVPENLHVTLAFLGEQNENVLPKIEAVLKETTNGIGQHPIRIIGCRIGPGDTIPRMLWLETDKDSESFLRALTQQVRRGLASKSISFDQTHGFNNHLTLARFSDRWQQSFLSKNCKQKSEEINRIKESLPESVSLPFQASSIILFESSEKDGQRIYSPLFESPFSG